MMYCLMVTGERLSLVASDYNVNYNVFNLDVFYTWDFRLGSKLFWRGRILLLRIMKIISTEAFTKHILITFHAFYRCRLLMK